MTSLIERLDALLLEFKAARREADAETIDEALRELLSIDRYLEEINEEVEYLREVIHAEA